MSKDLLLLETQLKIVLIIAQLIHHAIYFKLLKNQSLELEMVSADCLTIMLLDAILLMLLVWMSIKWLMTHLLMLILLLNWQSKIHQTELLIHQTKLKVMKLSHKCITGMKIHTVFQIHFSISQLSVQLKQNMPKHIKMI